jgi:lipopolysaccharide assembly outer membrane protein LptD (OstA)
MMTRLACIVFLSLAAFAAPAANILPIPQSIGDQDVEISADKFEVDQKTGWITVRNNVHVKTGNHSLTADKVRLNRETGDVQANGNVVIRQTGFGTWRGNYIEYNYKTGKGMTGAGQVDAGVFHLHADEVTRRDDGRFDLSDLSVTTCTNAPGKWHWCLRGDGRFRDNDYVEIYKVTPYLFGVPLAWLPYWYRDLDTHYGFRLMPGYTSKWGAYLLGGYVFPIYDAPDGRGPKLYGTFHLDYRTRRGVAEGQNVHWDLKRWGQGRFESYYAWDQDPPNSREDRNWMSEVHDQRYRFRLFHEADLTERDQFLLRGTVASDSEMRSDFFERENRGESIPMNFASLEHREMYWASGMEVSGPLNDFYSGSSRLPEGWLNVEPQPLFLGLNYESQTRAGYFDRDAARYDWASPAYKYYPGEWAEYNTVRADTAHRVTYPMKFDDWLSVVPRAGYRGTYYSDADGDSNIYRHSGDFGTEFSTRATSDWVRDYRHIFEPYVDYSYQPTLLTGDANRTYMFDRFDRSLGWQDQFGFDGTWLPYDWHGVRPGVRNIVETHDAKGRVRSLLDWDLYSAYQFDSKGPKDESGLRILGSKLIYTPTDDFDVKAQTEWDTEEDKMAYADLSTFYKVNEHLRVGGGYLARDHQLYDYDVSPVAEWNRMKENLAYCGFTHIVNDTWSYSPFVRYDLRADEVDEIGTTVQYSLDCLVFQLRLSYLNSFERIDGTERDSDFRISIMVWLRAQGKEPDEEWQRW